jgi:hypothetical protein
VEDNFNDYVNALRSDLPTIDSKQVSQLLGVSLRTAQDLLKNTRKSVGKPKNASVSVKEFCLNNYLPEEEVLKALQDIPPDSGTN